MKQMIWSSEDRLDDAARVYYQDFQREIMEDESYKVSDEEWADEVYHWLEDERSNLNKEIEGVIIAFAVVGTWRGPRRGYQIVGHNIAGILQSQCDEAEWYGDGYNIRGRMIHHDGTNYALYRVAKDRDTAERIAEKYTTAKSTSLDSDREPVPFIRMWQRSMVGKRESIKATDCRRTNAAVHS